MRVASLLIAAVVLIAAPADAQFREQAQEASGLGATVDLTFNQLSGGGDGSVGDSIGFGVGLAAFAFYQPNRFPARLGIGGSYTRFTTDGPGDAFNKLSLFAGGTWRIVDPNTTVIPYVGGRLGYVTVDDDEFFCLEQRAPTCPEEELVRGREWSGLEVGAVVGVDLPLSESVNVDVSGTFSWLALGDLTAEGETIDETSTNLSTFGLQAGLTILPH